MGIMESSRVMIGREFGNQYEFNAREYAPQVGRFWGGYRYIKHDIPKGLPYYRNR